jgi:hypothetical protein
VSTAARGPLWAITAFFNPAGSPRRLANYRHFRSALRVPLVAVELAYGPEFELAPADADILVQRRGRDVLWQNERLLNLALAALPPSCAAVAWLDADVVFAEGDWAAATLAALEWFALLQPFSVVHDAEGPVAPGDDWGSPTRRSLGSILVDGGIRPAQVATARFASDFHCTGGLAWAARRELLDRHGLYDAAIVGGGDRAIVCAALGEWDGLREQHALGARQWDHYLAWARPFHAATRGPVGCVPGALLNLHHGPRTARNYAGRHAGLARFGLDPAVDLARDDGGCWRWNTDRPDLHRYVREYLQSRGD